VLVCLCFLFVLSEQRLLTLRKSELESSEEVSQTGYGGQGGTAFNDGNAAKIYGPITALSLFTCTSGLNYVCGISVTYFDGSAAGTTVTHGTTTGTVTSTTFPATASYAGTPAGPQLQSQEHITGASGTAGTYLNSLTLTTNLGRSVTAGGAAGGTPFSTSSSGQVVGWFSGRSGSWMDNIAFNWIGPLAYIVYYSDGETFEISTVDPINHPVTSFTASMCTITGQKVPYLCGIKIALSATQVSPLVGVSSFSKGTVSSVTVNVPASSKSQQIQFSIYTYNFPTVGTQICGLVVGFAGTGVASVTIGTPTAGTQAIEIDYSEVSTGALFRGFKGAFTQVDNAYPSFTTNSAYNFAGFLLQD